MRADKMDDKELKVEAILFAVGKEITSERIACLCSLDVKEVDSIVKNLQKEYEQRNCSLQIIKKEGGWKFTVKDGFLPIVSNIVASTEMEKPLMETLAVIAWKYPVVQSEIVKLRGASAYDHMKQLEEQGLIIKEKFGRTFKVKLTKKFFEYFDLPSEEAKKAFLKLVPEQILKDAEEVHKEADEVERLIELEKKEADSKEEINKALGNIKKEN